MRLDEPRKAEWLSVLLVLVVGLALFARSVSFQFTNWDDDSLISSNRLVNPPTSAGFLRTWAEPHMMMYIPATYNLWWLLAEVGHWLGGPNQLSFVPPWPYHAANVLVHIINGLLVLGILRRIGFLPASAAFGALVFVCHPLQVEPVCWATGMKDLLSSLLALLGITAYLAASAHAKAPKPNDAYSWYSLALLSLFLGTLAKPGIVGAPLIAVCLDSAFIGGWNRGGCLRAIGLGLVIVPSLIWTQLAQPSQEFAKVIIPLAMRPTVASHALAFYASKVVLPVQLCIDYGLRPLSVVSERRYLVWALATPAFLLPLLFIRRDRRTLLVASAVFVFGVLPVLGLVPFVFQGYSTVADRYVYLSMLGAGIAAATLASWVPRTSRGLLLAGTIIVLGAVSWRQIGVWHDSISLMRQAVRVNPATSVGYLNIAGAILPPLDAKTVMEEQAGTKGHVATQRVSASLDEAREYSDQYLWLALAARPECGKPLLGLILSCAVKGQYEEALRLGEFAYVLGSIAGFDACEQVLGPYEMGWLYKETGRTEKARDAFKAALQDPMKRSAAVLMLGELGEGATRRPTTLATPSPYGDFGEPSTRRTTVPSGGNGRSAASREPATDGQ